MKIILIHSGFARFASSIVIVLFVFLAFSTGTTKAQSLNQGKVIWELITGDNLLSPVQRAAFAPKNETVYLATFGNLYAVKDGLARSVMQPPEPDARFGLAPGGKLSAWLIPVEGEEPYWDVYIRDLSSKAQIQLKPREAPKGFGGLYLGYQGNLIVTFTPLDDWRGITGRYRYTFWSRDGQPIVKVIRPTPALAVVASDGSSLMLLGEKEATAYSAKGEKLWNIEGNFRKGAIAQGGDIALLNPSAIKEINLVLIVLGPEKMQKQEMPTPVHQLHLTPDGKGAIVGGDRGRYFYLVPENGQFKEGKRLPFDREIFITEIEFVDHDTLAFGVLQREGDPPKHTWPLGGIAVINRDGKILFRKEFEIKDSYASRPAVDAAFGEAKIIGFTMDRTVLVELGH